MAHRKSSKRWLKEHFDDSFVKQAQAQGYVSRAVFKLKEIDQRDRLIRPGMTIVDLGAAPGGWSQYAAEILNGHGRIIALDILPMDVPAGVEFIQGDFTEQVIYESLLAQLGDDGVDLVISDMAPNLSGMKAVDQPRAMYLAEMALDFARRVLKENGNFLVKVFQGEGSEEFRRELRNSFASVTTRKPSASRARSAEVYFLARGYNV
jgi:23S rRNA (uridine2552-2'-O)-methyltransferase